MKRLTLLVLILLLTLIACAPTPTPTPVPPTAMAIPTATSVPTATATTMPTAIPLPPTATPLPQPTVTPTPDINKIRASIQASLDLYARAYTNNDEKALEQAVDSSAPYWRFVTTRFSTYQKSIFAGQTKFAYTVVEIKPREFGFVQARIQSSGGSEMHWLFHEREGKWVLAEPSVEEVGEVRTIEKDGFTFKVYPWADEVNDQVIALMVNGRARVLQVLGQVPEQKATVTIKPTYGVSPYDSPSAIAYYSTGFRGTDDLIAIYSPYSYGYGGYNAKTGWQADLETTLTHEYTHMVHRRSFATVGRGCDWTSEGLAEYTSGSFRLGAVRAAVQSGNIIPLVDTVSPVYKQDMNHMLTLNKDVSLAYGFAASLVKFIAENYGGVDAFWRVAKACDTTPDFDQVLQKSINVPLEKFDAEWRTWLKKY